MRTNRVLVAARPPAFVRLLEHVIGDAAGMCVVGTVGSGDALVRSAKRLSPDLIVVSQRLIGDRTGEIVASLRQSLPESRLILLTCPGSAFPPSSRTGVRCLPEADVVRRLVPAARTLVARPHPSRSSRAPFPFRRQRSQSHHAPLTQP